MAASALTGSAGTYRIGRTISDGGTSVVHEALELASSRSVALKRLVANDPGLRARFAREIRANERLKSRHVVRMLDHGVHEGAPFMVMELVTGEDLGRTLKQRGSLSLAEVSAIMLPVACALAEAHGAGVVHRDVKPRNILLEAAEPHLVRVLDFGIAKLDGQNEALDDELTRSFSELGTPAYMSPEQIRNAAAVDRATDVWSFGVVLFRALAGRLPFSGNAASLPVEICEDPPESLHTLRPDVPSEVVAAIEGALEKDRRLRPTLADLGDVLVAHVDSRAAAAHEAYAELARLSLSEL